MLAPKEDYLKQLRLHMASKRRCSTNYISENINMQKQRAFITPKERDLRILVAQTLKERNLEDKRIKNLYLT